VQVGERGSSTCPNDRLEAKGYRGTRINPVNFSDLGDRQASVQHLLDAAYPLGVGELAALVVLTGVYIAVIRIRL
jgi:hypothetical protein